MEGANLFKVHGLHVWNYHSEISPGLQELVLETLAGRQRQMQEKTNRQKTKHT
jgi:hypothetical protein